MENIDIEVVPTIITLLLTVISPLIAAWFTKRSMTSRTKNLIALGVSVVIAVGWVIFSGGFDGGEFSVAVATVYGLQQLVYNQLLKETAKEVEAHQGIGKNEAPETFDYPDEEVTE